MTSIKGLVLGVFLSLVGLSPAVAQTYYGDGTSFSNVYVGPGDIINGLTAWYGLRAYKAAYATGANNAITVRRASDNTTQNIVILPSGGLDTATAATFAGTDATATCSAAASTTLACTGASSTPNVGDQIYGTGVTNPTYLTACGTFTAGAGSCTMNLSQTVVSETVTFQVALYITTVYDQTLGLKCASASCNVVQATAANQPQLLFDCINTTLPCLNSTTAAMGLLSANNLTPATGNVSLSMVANTVSGGGLGTYVGERSTAKVYTANASSLRILGDSGGINSTASQNHWHAGNGPINGSSSFSNIDGTQTTGTVSGNTTAAAPAFAFGSASTTQRITEGGFWDNLAITNTQANSLCHNQYTYWATTTSC